MSGGLFGDLPATKEKKDGDETAQQPPSLDKQSDGAVSKDPSPTTTTTGKKKPDPFAAMMAPAAATKKKPKSSITATSASNPLLQAVGTAGTSMAFVPKAALKRKKPSRWGTSSTSPKIVPTAAAKKPPPTSVGPATTNDSSTTKLHASKSEKEESNSKPDPADEKVEIDHSSNKSATSSQSSATPTMFAYQTGFSTIFTTVLDESASNKNQQPQDIHATVAVDSRQDNPHHHGTGESASSSHHHHHLEYDTTHPYQTQKPQEEVIITDPYDPYVPNDLLQYWDRKALAEERLALQQQTQEALERQQAIRRKLEKERQELEQKGEYDKLALQQQKGQGGMGRGRGRGALSNLPAWLVEKQRKEKEGLGSGDGDKT
jgi:hypothetical protein